MNWSKHSNFINNRFNARRRKALEEMMQHQKRHREVSLRHHELERQRREIGMQIRALRRQKPFGYQEEQLDLTQKLKEIAVELDQLHFEFNLTARGRRSGDFRRYYRHVNRGRVFALLFNLILWFLLFHFGGISTGLKIVVLVYAVTTTAGGLFEMSFLMRVKDRILKPVDNLKRGVEEIAKGNYDVVVARGPASEIDSLIEAFNAMAHKLGESERQKAEYEVNRKSLLANISHDLKTPITSVQGYVEAIMARGDMPEDQRQKYLKIIYNNTDYMNRLIDDLFLFSKLDMQKLELHREKISIKPFMADLMEEFSLDLKERSTDFNYRDELARGRTVELDTRRFHQIIRNLIDNAVKYGPEGQLKIRARLYGSDHNIHIELSDNGPGIAAEDLDRVFERFYRVDRERTKDFASTGLGLAIARELVRAHGGEITVKSELGVGTAFTLTIPAYMKDLGKDGRTGEEL